MPIDGLSDVTRLPRLGKIHLGFKDQTKKGAPTATNYFVLPDKDEVGELAATMRKIYGEKPNELPIIFPIEDEDKFASQYYRCYSMTRGLVCKGDGKTCLQTVDTSTKALANRDSKPENIELQELPCKARECQYYKANQCREIMMLQFMLPDIPSIGIWQIDTSSVNSIININSAVKLYKGIFGRVSMLPLTLTLKPQDVVSPVDQKKKKVYTLHLEARASLKNMLLLLEKTPVQRLALTAPDESKPEIIEGEYEVKNGTAQKTDTPAPNIEQAERDSEELFPEGGTKGISAEKPSPSPSKGEVKEEKHIPGAIDMDWLKGSIKDLHWSETTFKTWLVSMARKHTWGAIDIKGSLTEVIGKLNTQQRELIVKEIQDMLDLR